MSGKGGGEVANILRNEQDTKRIPIFFLSVLVTKDDEKCTTKKDVTCLPTKPFERKELI